MSTFPQTDNHSWSCRTSILEGATFHKVSYCKFLWGNPCKAIETFFHWDSCLWDFWFSMVFAVVHSMIGVQQVLVSTHDRYHAWHRVSPVCRDFLSRAITGCRMLSCRSFFFNMAISLLSSFFLDLVTRLFINLTMCVWALFPKPTTTLGLVEQAFWRMPFSQNELV